MTRKMWTFYLYTVKKGEKSLLLYTSKLFYSNIHREGSFKNKSKFRQHVLNSNIHRQEFLVFILKVGVLNVYSSLLSAKNILVAEKLMKVAKNHLQTNKHISTIKFPMHLTKVTPQVVLDTCHEVISMCIPLMPCTLYVAIVC